MLLQLTKHWVCQNITALVTNTLLENIIGLAWLRIYGLVLMKKTKNWKILFVLLAYYLFLQLAVSRTVRRSVCPSVQVWSVWLNHTISSTRCTWSPSIQCPVGYLNLYKSSINLILRKRFLSTGFRDDSALTHYIYVRGEEWNSLSIFLCGQEMTSKRGIQWRNMQMNRSIVTLMIEGWTWTLILI